MAGFRDVTLPGRVSIFRLFAGTGHEKLLKV
jgi:hypothetical protein